jgi:deoxyadenosine/deoxycytidine kinase
VDTLNYDYIAIEGNIGSGKTSLARLLAARFGAELILEKFENNAFLPKFYQNPERYAFSLEMSFLAERYHQLSALGLGQSLFTDLTISDYLLSKSLIFASSNLKEDEMKLFRTLFDIMFRKVPVPDLLVYLYTDVDQLLANIRKRGRRYEQSIQAEYLSRIQDQYLDFFRKQGEKFSVLILDTTDTDFVENPEDFNRILSILRMNWGKGVHHQRVRSV